MGEASQLKMTEGGGGMLSVLRGYIFFVHLYFIPWVLGTMLPWLAIFAVSLHLNIQQLSQKNACQKVADMLTGYPALLEKFWRISLYVTDVMTL